VDKIYNIKMREKLDGENGSGKMKRGGATEENEKRVSRTEAEDLGVCRT
jgi:hypothetical protein